MPSASRLASAVWQDSMKVPAARAGLPESSFALFPTGLFEEMTADTARGLALRERRPTSVRQDWTISDLVGRLPAAAQPDTRTAHTTRITRA
jgi:hypothetical protein